MTYIETSLMVNDYPTAPEEKTRYADFDVYVKLKFREIELIGDETPEDFIEECGILDYDDYEIEDIDEV